MVEDVENDAPFLASRVVIKPGQSGPAEGFFSRRAHWVEERISAKTTAPTTSASSRARLRYRPPSDEGGAKFGQLSFQTEPTLHWAGLQFCLR
jgi:hypothetical protein